MFGAVSFGALSDRYHSLVTWHFNPNFDHPLLQNQIKLGDFSTVRRFGRRIMLLVSYVSGMLFACASAFSTTYVMFAVLRFFTGFCITGIVIVSTVLSNHIKYIYQFTFKLLKIFSEVWLLQGGEFCFVFGRCGVGGHWAQETGGSDWQHLVDIWEHCIFWHWVPCEWLAVANC